MTTVPLALLDLLIIMGAIIVSVSVLLLIVKLLFKGRIKIFGIELNASKSVGLDANIILSFRNIIKIFSRLQHINSIEMIKKQTDKAQEFLVKIKQDFYMKNFLDILSKKLNRDDDGSPTDSIEYFRYELLLHHWEDYLREILEAAFLNNGFHKLQEDAFLHYVKDKALYILSESNSFFNQRYVSKLVKRSELYDMENSEENIAKYNQCIFDIFKEADRVADTYHEEILKLEDELNHQAVDLGIEKILED